MSSIDEPGPCMYYYNNNFMIIATQMVTPQSVLTPVLEIKLLGTKSCDTQLYRIFAYSALHTVLQRNVLPADNSSINGNNIYLHTIVAYKCFYQVKNENY